MSHLLRWKPREATLSPKAAADQPATTPLARVDFDFDLTPVTLISEEDRMRLVDTMTNLCTLAGPENSTVEVVIPASWGVTLEVPHPGLAEAQLEEHLDWELSQALLGTLDHYRYGRDAETGDVIRLAALRTKLSDLIAQVVRDAGFKLRGIYLDQEEYAGINLGRRGAIRDIAVPLPVKKEISEPETTPPLEPEAEVPAEPVVTSNIETPVEETVFESEEPVEIPRRRFPLGIIAAVIVLGVAVVVGIKLFTSPKPTAPPEAERQTELAAIDTASQAPPATMPAQTDTASSQPANHQTPKVEPQASQAEPAPGELAQIVAAKRSETPPLSRRLAIMQEFLNRSSNVRLEVATFEARRFLFHITSSDSADIHTAFALLQSIAPSDTIKLKWTRSRDQGVVNANLRGQFTAGNENSAGAHPDSSSMADLATQHGLAHRALVFTGSRENLLAFLTDLAGRNYSFYRLVFMPWEKEEFRLVLDL